MKSHQVNNPEVLQAIEDTKGEIAKLIDRMNDLRMASGSADQKRHASVAITDLETACKRAVTALTWED